MCKTIMLVDDSASVRKVLRMMFEAAGYQIAAEFANGADAVQGASKIRPDLIVLDLSMPVMNGMEAAPLLRQELPTVPIILFTLFAQALSIQGVQAAGISSVVAKDAPTSKLIATVEELLH